MCRRQQSKKSLFTSIGNRCTKVPYWNVCVNPARSGHWAQRVLGQKHTTGHCLWV